MLLQFLKKKKEISCTTYEQAQQAVKNLKFCSECFTTGASQSRRHTNISKCALHSTDVPQAICTEITFFKRRCRTTKYVQVLDENKWPNEVKNNILFGDGNKFATYLKNSDQVNRQPSEKSKISDLSPDEIPEKISCLQHILDTIAISSSECERGFSQLIVIPLISFPVI